MADTSARMPSQNDLSNLDIDEVSPVRRGAIGKIWAFLKSNDEGDLELSKATVDAMGTPVDGEEALVAELEKSGADADAVEANVVVARLRKAFGIEKAKPNMAQIDAQENMNDAGGDNADDADDDADDAATQADLAKQTDAYKPFGPDKGGKKRKRSISNDPDPTDDLASVAKNAPSQSADDVGGNANEAKERVMADGLTGLVQKEDGSWDTSGVTDPSARSFYDNVLKSLDDAKAEGEALRESVKKAEADNAELKDKLVVKELTVAAESEYSKVAKADELVPVLKAAKDSMDAETFGKLTELLKAANARIEAGDLFAELGRSADPVIKDAIARGENFASGGGDAWDTIVEKANAMVLKEGDELSETQRIDRFLKTDEGKRLYADYRAENGAVA